MKRGTTLSKLQGKSSNQNAKNFLFSTLSGKNIISIQQFLQENLLADLQLSANNVGFRFGSTCKITFFNTKIKKNHLIKVKYYKKLPLVMLPNCLIKQ